MSVLLFRLRNVPDDEADDVRKLLHDNQIEFYETSAGSWGTSTAAIWLKHREELDKARELIDHYQQQRSIDQRNAYEELKKDRKHKTLIDSFRENPLRFIAYLVFIIVILYFSIKPFISLSSQAK
jgi:hypothetical protein